MSVKEIRYTPLASFLAQHVAFKSGVTFSDPFHQYGMCIACRRSAGHDADCLAVRARTMLYSVRFVAQFVVNDRVTTAFSVMGKRNIEAGTLFMYSVHAVVTNGSLRPHTTCSCGHCTPTALCDHANQVGAVLVTVGKVMKMVDAKIERQPQEMPNKGDHDGSRDDTYAASDYGTTDMPEPEMPPSTDLTPEDIAALQNIVGGKKSEDGKCNECGGIWGHELNCTRG